MFKIEFMVLVSTIFCRSPRNFHRGPVISPVYYVLLSKEAETQKQYKVFTNSNINILINNCTIKNNISK